jgi:hypothetical protein
MTNNKTKPITSSNNKNNNSKPYKYLLIAIVAIATVYLVYDVFIRNKTNYSINGNRDDNVIIKEPMFSKHGELKFIKSGNDNIVKKTIDIEIAETDTTREQGLMYRKSMQDNQGMLFIFEKPSIHSFWMKNTLISLDIIFVDERKEIINIYQSTTKKSLKSLPSLRPALYVVEVNSGFTDKYEVKEGDKIEFERK